jgi:hypothetical protein
MEDASEDYWSVQRKLTPFLELQRKGQKGRRHAAALHWRHTAATSGTSATGQVRGRHAGLMLPPLRLNAATPGPSEDRTETGQHAG